MTWRDLFESLKRPTVWVSAIATFAILHIIFG